MPTVTTRDHLEAALALLKDIQATLKAARIPPPSSLDGQVRAIKRHLAATPPAATKPESDGCDDLDTAIELAEEMAEEKRKSWPREVEANDTRDAAVQRARQAVEALRKGPRLMPHTPAPWSRLEVRAGRAYCDPRHDEDDETARANHRLALAAPDLLRFAERLAGMVAMGHRSFNVDEVRKEAERLIEKATGAT